MRRRWPPPAWKKNGDIGKKEATGQRREREGGMGKKGRYWHVGHVGPMWFLLPPSKIIRVIPYVALIRE